MATWKEIERLQSDFQRAQESTAVLKLSERNCIEILIKLQEMKLLEIIHTIDGKEYITPSQLAQEIRDELYVHGGRVSLVELQSLLNVDYSHIETKANEIASSSKSVYIVLGQLVDKTYLDHMAEEINDNLQSVGQVTIADLCKTYDLPGDFLVPELISRLGSIISGRLDETNKDAIFTESFIATHKARIRGILTAITRPASLNPILTDFKMSSKLFFAIVDALIAENRIRGSIANRRSEKSTFLPEMYVRTQNQWVDNFYRQNNYLEYEALSRLDIDDPKAYIRRRYKDLLPLTTLCVGQSIVELISATVEDTLSADSWTDVWPLLPTPCTTDDCNHLLNHILSRGKQKKNEGVSALVVGGIVSSRKFVDSCKSFFDVLIKEKAERKIKDATVFALTEEEIKMYGAHQGEGKTKTDKREDRRKKATEGASSGSGGGSGIGAREVKTKGKDKKRLKKQRELEAEMEEIESSHRQSSKREEEFMDVREIVKILMEKLETCPEEFCQLIAEEIHRPLNKRYQEVSKSIFQLTMSEKTEEGRANEKGSPQKKTRRSFEEEINTIWSNVRLFSDSLDCFEGDLQNTLERHLLRTVCSDLVNMLFNMVGSEHLAGVEESNKMTPEMRMKILTKLPQEYQIPLRNLHQSLTGKSLVDFNSAFTESCSHNVCSIMLKKTDKKRDRQVLHGHKMSLLKKLESEEESAMALHLAVVIIFQSVTGHMLHIPGKCVPNVITHLRTELTTDVYMELVVFQNLVMQKLTMDTSEEDSSAISKDLEEKLPKLRELAATTKKKKNPGVW